MSLEVDIRKLRVFNEMARRGGNTVAQNLSTMTGLDTAVEITKINFLRKDDVDAHIGHDQQIGVTIDLLDAPHGSLVFLFSHDSAKELAGSMMGGASEGPLTDMEKSAVQEIGNIMSSAFIDGWAEVFSTTIDISTPNFRFDAGPNIIKDAVAGHEYDMVMLFDSHVSVPDSDVTMTIYMFPDLEELVDLMQRLQV